MHRQQPAFPFQAGGDLGMKTETTTPGTWAADDRVKQEAGFVSAPVYSLMGAQHMLSGFGNYMNDFMIPWILSTQYFQGVEQRKLLGEPPWESIQSYNDLFAFNWDLTTRAFWASTLAVSEFIKSETPQVTGATVQSFLNGNGKDLTDYYQRLFQMSRGISVDLPEQIRGAAEDFGFHFEREEHPMVAETDRFYLYQVMPNEPGVVVQEGGKPILIIPPFVLGANILGFLPGEKRSYAHSFANHGVPTYIRVMKDIQTNEAFQVMTGEDDARDTRYFCERIMKRHGRAATLNGYCQGGFASLCNLLSGELDGLVDAFITCVAPMDGTRSDGFKSFFENLPQRFNDLAYGTKILPSGNKVADGTLMGWVYKLKSIENEYPVVAMLRDMALVGHYGQREISKSILAIKYWLLYERNDLPLPITEMSFASYNEPIRPDGTLPVKLFGRSLNLNRLKEKKIPWLICYGEKDDLVEKETALAPCDFIPVEVTPFPKGHVAIATSWSHPDSACDLAGRFGEGNYRGPVRFHLDLLDAVENGTDSATL
jgi:hypothetical protein